MALAHVVVAALALLASPCLGQEDVKAGQEDIKADSCAGVSCENNLAPFLSYDRGCENFVVINPKKHCSRPKVPKNCPLYCNPCCQDYVPIIDATGIGNDLVTLEDHKLSSPKSIVLVVDTALVKTETIFEGKKVEHQFKTRVYKQNGVSAIGGPRWEFLTGDKVQVILVNRLTPVDNSGKLNDLRDPNVTNLHTHGLHISGESPYDNVSSLVGPGMVYTYRYVIADDHLPGHLWYHPHWHGSTHLQTSGGLYGSIVIDDPLFVEPEEITDIPIQYLEILNMPFCDPDGRDCKATCCNQFHFNKALLNPVPHASGWPEDTGDAGLEMTAGNNSYLLLVNGHPQPKITIQRNKWHRYRILYASTINLMFTVIKDEMPWNTPNPACEWRLLAHDGNYLPARPRKFGILPLIPAAREDIVFRCTKTGTYSWEGIKHQSTEGGKLSEDDWKAAGVNVVVDNAMIGSVLGKVATFEVVDKSPAVEATELDVFHTNRPCYVSGTWNAPEDVIQRRHLSYRINLDAQHEASFPINQMIFTERPDAFLMPNRYAGMSQEIGEAQPLEWHFEPTQEAVALGKVVEFSFKGVNWHPSHMHINPVQLYAARDGDDGPEFLKTYSENNFSGFHMLGDWHDVLLIGANSTEQINGDGPGGIKARMKPDVYTGQMVVHCHILGHEDKGMIGLINITGTPGTPAYKNWHAEGCGKCYQGKEGKGENKGRGYCYVKDAPAQYCAMYGGRFRKCVPDPASQDINWDKNLRAEQYFEKNLDPKLGVFGRRGKKAYDEIQGRELRRFFCPPGCK